VRHNPHVDVLPKPRLRGVFHHYAFYVALVAGVVLVALSDSGRELVATWIYAVALAAMFGVSALYHRIDWRSARVRAWMRRLDHSTILLLIAGTYTPFALLAFDGGIATVILVAVWAGAAAGLVLNLAWIDAPKGLVVAVFLLLGWVGVIAVPELLSVGVAPAVLVFVGGGLYTLGALAYALKRPDPVPAVFGYHEIFHLCVIGAAAAHFIAIAAFVAPRA
jgi:hemolysin III